MTPLQGTCGEDQLRASHKKRYRNSVVGEIVREGFLEEVVPMLVLDTVIEVERRS